MNTTNMKSTLMRRVRERPVWFLAGAGLLIALVGWAMRTSEPETTSALYTVKRGDFLISIVEGGTIQAVNEVNVRNEVEGVARIIFIVPEGTYVKKGDLLVELDSANAQDQLNQQTISVEKAQFALIQAKEQLQIQKSIVESEVRAAELKLEFARSDLKKYLEGEARQERRKAEIEIASIREKLAIDEDKLKWSEKLHDKGFETKSNLDRDRLTVTQSVLNLEIATNSLWMIEEFDSHKKRRTYESNVEEAEKDLERVKHQGSRKLAQYEADVRTQEITLKLSQDKLERDRKQLVAAKIYAPQDGLVVYPVGESHFSSESMIEEGATVRNRQTLVKLPDVSEMKLTVKIHESHINMIQPGLAAFIVLDSMPDLRFQGEVSRVALLPDTQSRWGNPNLKVYATEIVVLDELPDVKPGVSARAEIIVTNLQNVISVPIQAVTTKQGKPVVYVADGHGSKPVSVQVGLYNTKYIEVTSGLKGGEQILLAPPFDTQEKDLGGAVVSEGETNVFTNSLATARRGTNGAAARAAMRAERERPPGEAGANDQAAPRPDRGVAGGEAGARRGFEEIRKQFDKNGDGELDESERQAMRAAMQERFGQGGGPGGEGRSRRSGGPGDVERGGSGAGRDAQPGGEPRRNREPRPDRGAAPGAGSTRPAE
jgi:HlyD family secretion protein